MLMFYGGTWLVPDYTYQCSNSGTWLVAIGSTEIHASFLNALITGTVVTTYYFFYIYL